MGLLNLKGLGRDSGKTRVLKRWQLDKVNVQETCVDFLDTACALGTVSTARLEEWIIGAPAQSGDLENTAIFLNPATVDLSLGLLLRLPPGPAPHGSR